MIKDETRTEQVVLLNADNQYGEIERFLQRGQQSGEVDKTTIEREKLERFWRVLGIVTRFVLEETGLEPVYLDRMDGLHDGQLYWQDVTLGFLSSQKGGAIIKAVAFSMSSLQYFGIDVRAVPITLLGEIPEISPEIVKIIKEWCPNNRTPTPCVFQTYEKLPLKCSGGLAVAPWAVASSLYLLKEEPDFIASRVVQYINLGCEYESIRESFTGIDLPFSYKQDEPAPRHLIAGYTSDIPENKNSRYGWAGENYALLCVAAKVGLHSRKKDEDLCVITESSYIIIDLDDPSDTCYTFAPHVVVGNEGQSPLRDILDGRIPPDVVTNFVDHIRHETCKQEGGSFHKLVSANLPLHFLGTRKSRGL